MELPGSSLKRRPSSSTPVFIKVQGLKNRLRRSHSHCASKYAGYGVYRSCLRVNLLLFIMVFKSINKYRGTDPPKSSPGRGEFSTGNPQRAVYMIRISGSLAGGSGPSSKPPGICSFRLGSAGYSIGSSRVWKL